MARTIMGTVTVNAAFLQEVKEDNHLLRSLLETARQVFAESSRVKVDPKELAELLGQLRDQLAMHFALEEAFGYFEEAIDVAPRLSEQADLLRAQHRGLYLEVCDIADEAEQLLYHETAVDLRQEIRARFFGFLDRLNDHEACENALILEAFDEDLGVGD